MKIGGKEYKVGQHIRVVSAKSVLHYVHGMTGDVAEEMEGLTGIIIAPNSAFPHAVASIKVDEPYARLYHNGMTRLFEDDEIELVDEEEEAWKNAYEK